MMSTSKTIYLHIGYPKTGTTSIQLSLYQAHHQLAKYGYYFPKTRAEGIGKLSLHRWISNTIYKNESDDNIVLFRHELQQMPHHNIILTAEEISDFGEAEIRYFATMFAMFDIYVVIYLRRQDLYLQSLWSQYIKVGKISSSFAEWIDETLTNTITISFTPHYHEIISIWSDIFGKNHIIIRPFEQSQLYESPFFDFLQVCNVDHLSEFKEVSPQNISPSMKTLEILRRLTHLLNISDLTHNHGRRRKLYAKLNDIATGSGWNTETLNLLSPELHTSIMSIFEDSNRKIAQTYLKQEKLFIEPFQENPISRFQNHELTDIELVSILSSAFDQATQNVKFNHKQITYNELIDDIRLWIFD